MTDQERKEQKSFLTFITIVAIVFYSVIIGLALMTN